MIVTSNAIVKRVKPEKDKMLEDIAALQKIVERWCEIAKISDPHEKIKFFMNHCASKDELCLLHNPEENSYACGTCPLAEENSIPRSWTILDNLIFSINNNNPNGMDLMLASTYINIFFLKLRRTLIQLVIDYFVRIQRLPVNVIPHVKFAELEDVIMSNSMAEYLFFPTKAPIGYLFEEYIHAEHIKYSGKILVCVQDKPEKAQGLFNVTGRAYVSSLLDEAQHIPVISINSAEV